MSVAGADPSAVGPALRAPIRLALWLVSAAVVAGWIVLAALHLRDDYRISHVQGIWIAATASVLTGHVYPPIVDGEHYAGTRYMPLPLLLNALAATVFGDPAVGGKLLAAVLMAALLSLIVWVLRRNACPWPLAVTLAAVVVATDVGLQAGTTIGGDLLPVLLQVGALAVATSDHTRARLRLAGGLAGLAVASKLTGLWALFGIATWLALSSRWRSAGRFATAGAATAGAVLGTVQFLTGGGLFQHLLSFSVAGVHGVSAVVRAPNQVLFNVIGFAVGVVVLLPLAVAGTVLASRWQQSAVHVSLGYALACLLVAYTDIGTGANQLLDLVVLTVLAVGQLAGQVAVAGGAAARKVTLQIVSIAVCWAIGLDLVRTVGVDLRRTVSARRAGQAPGRAARLVADLVGPNQRLFSEDPSIDVAAGRRPIVMDPFMLSRLDRSHPEWVDPLLTQIRERRFHVVALVVSLEDRHLDYWWSDFHFGPRVAEALRASYRFDRRVGRYFLYRPVAESEGSLEGQSQGGRVESPIEGPRAREGERAGTPAP